MQNEAQVIPNKRVLVVGDWVIDEHWVTSVHRSRTRSRAGRHHSRVLNSTNGWVLTLAGAGKTAEVLSRAGFAVKGAGEWNQKDDGAIAQLLTGEPTEFHHFDFETLTSAPSDELLVNLGGAKSITTRVIRMWQQQGSRYEIVNRIDWEVGRDSPQTPDNLSKLQASDFDAVVLKDMDKGVVSRDVVRHLRQAGAKQWFVSSKLWRPDWFETLAEEPHRNDVRLILIPQVAATAALRQGISRWFINRDLISPEACDVLGQLRQDFPEAVICVLPNALSLIALVKIGDQRDELFTFVHEPTEQYQTEMPMASVFLPTMTATMLKVWPEGQGRDFRKGIQDRLTQVLTFTDKWMHHQFGRITAPGNWKAAEELRLKFREIGIVSDRDEPNHHFDVRLRSAHYRSIAEEWEQACSGRFRAIIAGSRIETRRAAIEVDGYVCLVKHKREVLRRLLSEIRSFDPDSGVSKSFILIAKPGSGKSYLVEKLAAMEGLEPLMFNITSLHSRLDLLDCFDTIVTSQAAKRDKRFLVFFDEIDANLDGQPVYDAFLRPLEEGLYIRAGKAFHVRPCIWMFCGTRSPADRDLTIHPENARKGSDFLSRLSLPQQTFDYDLTENGVDELARLENVYAGINLLKRPFPDVTKISKAVLETFYLLPPKTVIREIDRFVKRFSQIQYGKVKANNLQEIPWKDDFRIPERTYEEWSRNHTILDRVLIAIDPQPDESRTRRGLAEVIKQEFSEDTGIQGALREVQKEHPNASDKELLKPFLKAIEEKRLISDKLDEVLEQIRSVWET